MHPFLCSATRRSLGAGLLLLTLTGTATAQMDRVYPQKGSTVQGVVKSISKESVKVQVGGTQQDLPTNTIRRIIFEGDPGSIGKGRDQILDGQYDTGLAEVMKTDFAKLSREEVKAEYMFYRAFAEGKLALAGRGKPTDAVKNMLAFVKQYPDSWHYFDAAEMLGDLAMSMGSFDNAAKFYGALSNSSFPELKLKASYLEGKALLKSGKAADAMARFQAVASASSASEEGVRYQKMASAGVVTAMAQGGDADKALTQLTALVSKNDPADIEVSAQLYNAQGFCLLQKQDFEGAVLSYLHTDLLFSAATDAHTEALKQLVQLWGKLGQPDRAAATRTKLERLYPGAKI